MLAKIANLTSQNLFVMFNFNTVIHNIALRFNADVASSCQSLTRFMFRYFMPITVKMSRPFCVAASEQDTDPVY